MSYNDIGLLVHNDIDNGSESLIRGSIPLDVFMDVAEGMSDHVWATVSDQILEHLQFEVWHVNRF